MWRRIGLSVFAVVLGLHAALADPCDDRITAFNKSADKQLDAGLDAVAATFKMTAAERAAAMCRSYKADLEGWGKQLAELKKIEAACGARKSASYRVRDVELILTKTEKEIAANCK